MQFQFHANQSHFHKNGFALKLALKQRKGTRELENGLFVSPNRIDPLVLDLNRYVSMTENFRQECRYVGKSFLLNSWSPDKLFPLRKVGGNVSGNVEI